MFRLILLLKHRLCENMSLKQKESIRNLTYKGAYIYHSRMPIYIIRYLNIYKNLDAILQNSVGKKRALI